MRKINLLRLSLILSLILAGSSAFAQGGPELGVFGPMNGRVTNASGNGIGGAIVSVIAGGSCFDWEGVSVRTNPFGYYRLRVHYDCTLLVSATRKNRTFSPSLMIITIDGNYQNINFLAN